MKSYLLSCVALLSCVGINLADTYVLDLDTGKVTRVPSVPAGSRPDYPGERRLADEFKANQAKMAGGGVESLPEIRFDLRALKTAAPVQSVPYSSPSGYHRHVTRDGTIIEHHDSNYGSAPAHADVIPPWYKYYGPKAPAVRR